MIVAEQKSPAEMHALIGDTETVLVVGCGTCVTVCFAGGAREAAIVAAAIRMSTRLGHQEKRVAEQLGTRLTPGSGAGPFLSIKNDSQNEDFVVENKFTDNKSKFSIQYADVTALYKQARLQGKTPIFQMDFNEIAFPCTKEWVMVELDFFKELLDLWKSQNSI